MKPTYKELLEMSVEDLASLVVAQGAKIDSLEAHCEFLRECCHRLGNGLKVEKDEVDSIPQHSLNKIKAQAIEEMIESCGTGVPMRCAELTYTLHDLILLENAKDYANQLRGEK